jgi:hypothetical protein
MHFGIYKLHVFSHVQVMMSFVSLCEPMINSWKKINPKCTNHPLYLVCANMWLRCEQETHHPSLILQLPCQPFVLMLGFKKHIESLQVFHNTLKIF